MRRVYRSESHVIFMSCQQVSAHQYNLEKAVAFACTTISAEVNHFLTRVVFDVILNILAINRRLPLISVFLFCNSHVLLYRRQPNLKICVPSQHKVTMVIPKNYSIWTKRLISIFVICTASNRSNCFLSLQALLEQRPSLLAFIGYLSVMSLIVY